MTLESWSTIARQLGNRINAEKGGFLSGCVYAYFVSFILICSFGMLYVIIVDITSTTTSCASRLTNLNPNACE